MGVVSQLTHNVHHASPYSGLTSGGGNAIGSGLELGSAYDSNGKVEMYPLGSQGYINPLINSTYEYTKLSEQQGTKISASGYINLEPVKGLTLRSVLGTNIEYNRSGTYYDAESTDRYLVGESLSIMGMTNQRFLIWDNVLSYARTMTNN